MTKPITPSEALGAHTESIPDEVFQVFNIFLAARFSDEKSEVIITQKEVLGALELRRFTRKELFEKKWLDIEPTYRKVGWNVKYDKPSYCENYEPTWTFSKEFKR